MALEFLAIGMICGVAVAEIPARLVRIDQAAARLRQIATDLQAFRHATDDDARQALAIRSGSRILGLGLATLGVILGMAGVAYLGSWALPAGDTDQMGYYVVASVAGAGWWSLRGRMRVHFDGHGVEGRAS